MKMSEMSVELLNSMGDDLSVVNAARVSFAKEALWEEGADEHGPFWKVSEKDEKLIKYLAEHDHWSPFAHTSISFRVKAPIFIARQLAKHQVGFSWNEVSRRYVSDEPEFYFPKVWRKKAENVKQGSSEEGDAHMMLLMYKYCDTCYPEELIGLASDFYLQAIKQGYCPEQVRMILPQNMMTEWIWTGSLYGFSRVVNQRLDSHAQKEVQEIAGIIKVQLLTSFPISAKYLLHD